jgi:hypothetical protein
MMLYRARLAATMGAALMVLVPATANASTGFGSAAIQSARYCRDALGGGGSILPANVNCIGPANPNSNPPVQRVEPGGDGIAIDSAFDTIIGGRIESRVLFGELDLPIIKSGVWSDPDSRLASTINAYMGFTFKGADPTLYALDAVIDWTGSGAPQAIALNGGEYGGEGIGTLQLVLFNAAFVPAFADAASINQFMGSKFCGSAGVLASSNVSLASATAGSSAVTGSLSSACGGGDILLQPGGDYVLFAKMTTLANRGGFLDATNTVTVQLAEDLAPEVRDTLLANIVSARSLVPEPGSWAMLIAGFGLTGTIMRRRRAALA